MALNIRTKFDGPEMPRMSETVQLFGNANPASGVPVTHVAVASGASYSSAYSLLKYNNMAMEADTVMGSGTDCIEVWPEFSRDEVSWGRITARNFADSPGSVQLDQPQFRIISTGRFPFPVTFEGFEFVRWGQQVPTGCTPVGTQIALSMSFYETEQ